MRPPSNARTHKAALQRYKEVLQLSLSCVSGTAQWITFASSRRRDVLVATTSDDPVVLRRDGLPNLSLTASQEFNYRERDDGWHVHTLSYEYQVVDPEVFLWHWHPATRPGTHLHVHAEHGREGWLGKLHVPTERVAFEQVVRFLIEEMGVAPQRRDWDDVLREAEDRFRRHRTWPGQAAEPAPE